MGNIYKAKVDNVLRGMEAAFVDLGLPRNGFLHVDDVVVAGHDSSRTRARRKIDESAEAGPGGAGPGRQGLDGDEGRRG